MAVLESRELWPAKALLAVGNRELLQGGGAGGLPGRRRLTVTARGAAGYGVGGAVTWQPRRWTVSTRCFAASGEVGGRIP